MTSRLIESFQESDMSITWALFFDVLLCILVMGSCASWDMKVKGWFVLELRRDVRIPDLQSVEGMEYSLRGFLFVAVCSTSSFCKLLEEHLN
jgi:hypothetical protein